MRSQIVEWRKPLSFIAVTLLTAACANAPSKPAVVDTPLAKPPAITAAAAATSATAAAPKTDARGSFADNPIVYFVITDRFHNGNPANDNSYGRKREKEPRDDIGTFHGGDLAGLTQKLKDGWFKQLGVNAIWITAPYEQIRGWVVGGNKEFKHYAYHGYYALDFTVLDKNMGTEAELKEFVDTAHAQGIRVLFDIVMNHPGYGDLWSLNEFKVGVLWKEWETATLRDYHSYIDYNNPKWLEWWGKDWIRSGLRGYEELHSGTTEYTKQLAYLPDFKTEASKTVDLPPFLKNKPDTRAKPLPNATVRDYLVTWLTDWVRRFGIDGFRADTVKHVEPESWAALKTASVAALDEWRKANPGKSPDNAPFWMTGEYWGHDIERTPLFDAGFDNMINFNFQDRVKDVIKDSLDTTALDKLYADYAKTLASPAKHNVLSYLSSHDTQLFDRKSLRDAGTALMLAPGGVQIYYGDETARPDGLFTSGDKQQSTRSDMNWSSIDKDLLAHWQKLGQFRAKHVALSRGQHTKLADVPYTFSRRTAADKVVVAIGVKDQAITVGDVFANGQSVRDAYSGVTGTVKDGKVALPSAQAIVLLEGAP